jgi:type IV pilus assembly protein PilM
MEILPKNLGTRPRLAVEIRPEGVIAARAEDAAAVLTAIAERPLPRGAFLASLKPGNITDRVRTATALREALDAVASRGGERTRYVTLVVPDAATRVLLLDFDELPAKPAEALPIVRFRLKKLVPFDVDHAMVSYQVMSSEQGTVRVLAVAMPGDVLEEYESAVTAAGYTPGAVLPSTLATLAALDEQESPALVVNAGRGGVTTAIVRGGTVLLHRALELAIDQLDQIEHLDQHVDVIDALHATQDRPGYDRIEAQATIEAQVVEDAAAYMTEREIAQAISVAAAYFEDTLASLPEEIVSAGTIGADKLKSLLEENGMTDLRVREMVTTEGLAAGAATRVPRGWMAGVRGALRN